MLQVRNALVCGVYSLCSSITSSARVEWNVMKLCALLVTRDSASHLPYYYRVAGRIGFGLGWIGRERIQPHWSGLGLGLVARRPREDGACDRRHAEKVPVSENRGQSTSGPSSGFLFLRY